MGRSVNRAILIGHVGSNPEVRTNASGARVASFSLATSRRVRSSSGQPSEKTEWHRVVAWDRLVDVVERQVRKGERIVVEGRLEYRTWQTRDGHARQIAEVIAVDIMPAVLDDSGPVQLDAPEQREALKRYAQDLPF